jgi:hypothetical protein
MYIPPELKKSLNIPLSPSASALNDLIGAVRQYKTTGKIKKLFNAAAKGDITGIETLLATGFDLAGYKNKDIGAYGTKKYLLSAIAEAARHGQPEAADILAAAVVGDTARLSRFKIKERAELMLQLGTLALEYYERKGKFGADNEGGTKIPGDPSRILTTHKNLWKHFERLHYLAAGNDTHKAPAPLVNVGRLVVQALTAPVEADIIAPTRAKFSNRRNLQA